MNGLRMFGNAPVPFTVSWSDEADFYVAGCPHARMRAICQSVSPGSGKPQFGKPHSQRQRQAIAEGRCDLCGRSLKNRTKVSLSHARVRSNGAEGPCVMQVEPLVHRECGALCIRFCPSLKRDVETGALMVRQVNRYRVQFAIMSPEYIAHYVPGYIAAPTDRIVGHAKVELQSWTDRDEAWLERAAG
jgi:hypothetical protein